MERKDYLQGITTHLRTTYNLSDEKINDMLPRFISRLAEHLRQLELEITNNNVETTVQASHTLKGALLSLGLKELADQAWVLEKRHATNDDSIDYEKVFTILQGEIRLILEHQPGS